MGKVNESLLDDGESISITSTSYKYVISQKEHAVWIG